MRFVLTIEVADTVDFPGRAIANALRLVEPVVEVQNPLSETFAIHDAPGVEECSWEVEEDEEDEETGESMRR